MKSSWLVLLLAAAACARSAPPLPGDSVSADGAVALSPPKFSTVPSSTAPQDRTPLGPVESKLFAPELVMEHQGAIGVTPDQRDSILKEVERGQAAMLRLQWELNGDKEKLVGVLDADKVDEAKAAEAASHVMQDEDRIKSEHLSMLVRIKNALTAEQQAKLRALRDEDRGVPGAKDGG